MNTKLLSFSFILAACGASPSVSAPGSTSAASADALQMLAAKPVTTPVTVPGLIDGFSVDQVTPHVFVMHAYSNATIYDTGDGLVLVDTMLPPAFAAAVGENDLQNMQTTIAALASRGLIATTHVATVVYTHWHTDHMGNTDTFRDAATTVVGARGTTERIAEPQVITFFGLNIPAWPATFWPSHEVVGTETLAGPGGMVATYAPYSHTTTDLVVTLPKEHVVVTGDVLLQGYLAFTDVPNGGSMRGLLLSAQSLLDQTPAGYKIVPGHNKVMSKPEAQAWVTAMREATAYVASHVVKGQTLAQIQSAAAAAPSAGGFSANIAALDTALLPESSFVEWIYQDLTERQADALVAARKLATLPAVSTADMIGVIDLATTDHALAASTEYDTLIFEVDELENIDANSGAAKILSDGARAAFAIYASAVQAARADGQAGLSKNEYAAMQAQLAAL